MNRILKNALVFVLLAGSVAANDSGTSIRTTTEKEAAQSRQARAGVTPAEVDEAVAKASQVRAKMSVAQVESIVGRFDVSGKGVPTEDILKSLPKVAGIKVTASNSTHQFVFVSDAKGNFSLVSWGLLPGAAPSKP